MLDISDLDKKWDRTMDATSKLCFESLNGIMISYCVLILADELIRWD